MLTQTFNISLPVELVRRADFVAKNEFRNRSELIKEALRSYLTSKQTWDELYEYGSKVAKKMNIKTEDEVVKIVNDYRNGR